MERAVRAGGTSLGISTRILGARRCEQHTQTKFENPKVTPTMFC